MHEVNSVFGAKAAHAYEGIYELSLGYEAGLFAVVEVNFSEDGEHRLRQIHSLGLQEDLVERILEHGLLAFFENLPGVAHNFVDHVEVFANNIIV